MTTLAPTATQPNAMSSRCLIDSAGVAAHGIGRGEFSVLVFSGARAALGDIAGYSTWQTARKYVLADPRRSSDDDFAKDVGQCLALWPESAEQLTPHAGVCFVFDDEHHPAIVRLQQHGGEEFEHFVSLDRLTLANLHERQLRRFVAQSGERPILLLGYGDQGRRIGSTLTRLIGSTRNAASRVFVYDSSEARTAQARADGFNVATLDDLIVERSAVVCTPLARPAVFTPILEAAARTGRPVLDNSLGWDARPEYRPRDTQPSLFVSPTADRLLETAANPVRLRAASPRATFTFSVMRDDLRRLGNAVVPHLLNVDQVTLTHDAPTFELSQPLPDEPLRQLVESRRGVFVNLDGQSNYHDAALAIFATRRFLAEFFPDQVRELLPSELRASLGTGSGVAGAFESLVIRSSCGRSLGAAFMTSAEQTALGVAARAGCRDGEPVIEIGSALGGSACLIAAATTDHTSPIWSIDPDQPTRASMRAALQSEGYAERLTQIVNFSNDAVDDIRTLVDRHGPAGFVFIDGLHTYDAVTDDIRHYNPFLKLGGILALHDVNPRHAGLWRAACETIESRDDLQVICIVDSLVLLRKAH